jgi:hypothetical protein
MKILCFISISRRTGLGAVRTMSSRAFRARGHAEDVVCCAGYDDSLRTTGHGPLTMEGVRVFVSGTAYRPQMVRAACGVVPAFHGRSLVFVLRRGGL